MTDSLSPDVYAVFGDPIAQSKSPFIHQRFAEQTQQALVYERQQVNGEGFKEAAEQFFAAGGKGLNITAPCKLNAFDYAQSLTERARRAGAVNTLIRLSDDSVQGDTTDGVGLVSDICQNLSWQIEGLRVLVLGAGGAVRGVLEPLLRERPESLLIANRTASKASQLAQDFADLCSAETRLSGVGYEALEGQTFDLVINGTSASLSQDLPPLPDTLLSASACCYDMTYSAEPTVFLQWAEAHGAAAISDGLGMLVGQAAESFQLWRGVQPDTQPVIAALRQLLRA